MLKIGIITIHKIYNYGSVLQAYALQEYCRKCGFNVVIIDYEFPNDYHRQCASENFVKIGLSISKKKKIKSLIIKFLYSISLLRQHKAIREFVDNYLILTDEKYSSPEQLLSISPKCDIFITGSDQVWNPRYCYGDPSFLLHFASDGKKKIAYAASFGTADIDQSFYCLFASLLSKYTAISVRENSGVDLVGKIAGMKSLAVLDPTLLLEAQEWEDILKPANIEGKYIVCYYLNYSFNAFPYVDKLATHIQKITGYKIVRVARPPEDFFSFNTKIKVSASPEEFLGLIKNAAFVLTTSFHGTAFALNFSVPMFSIVEDRKTSDSRVVSLLTSVGLSSRILSLGDPFPSVEALPCDYSQANAKLANLREISKSFLQDSLL